MGDASVLCMRCACDLGDAQGKTCPECGLPAAKSIPFCDGVRDLPLPWLHRQLWGIHLLLLSITTFGLLLLARELLKDQFSVLVLPALYVTFACWQLSRPRTARDGAGARLVLRLVGLLSLLAALTSAAGWSPETPIENIAACLFVATGLILLPALIGFHLRRLLILLHQRHWPGVAAALGILGSLLIAGAALTLRLESARTELAMGLLWCLGWIGGTALVLLLVRMDLLLLRARRIAAGGNPAAAPRDGLWCVRCSYDLRDLDTAGRCPECGLAIERSLALGRALHDSRPAWIASLSAGVWLLLASFGIAGAVLTVPLWADWIDVDEFTILLLIAAAALFAAGIWILTRPENPHAMHQPLRPLAKGLRWIAAILSASVLTAVAAFFSGLDSLIFAGGAGAFVAMLSCPVLLFSLLRRLAFRVMDYSLGELSTIVGWGTSLTIIGGVVVSAMVSHPFIDQMFGILMLTVATACALLAIMSCFGLLLHFAAAFHRAGKQARAAWHAADPSAPAVAISTGPPQVAGDPSTGGVT